MSKIILRAGASHVFPAGLVTDLRLDNRDNGRGTVSYQVGASPWMEFGLEPGEFIIGVNGQSLSIRNNSPVLLYASW